MKKGILLTLVFAGWFLAKNQSSCEVLLNKQPGISEKTGQLVYSLKECVWHSSATGFRKTPVAIPVSYRCCRPTNQKMIRTVRRCWSPDQSTSDLNSSFLMQMKKANTN